MQFTKITKPIKEARVLTVISLFLRIMLPSVTIFSTFSSQKDFKLTVSIIRPKNTNFLVTKLDFL